MRFPDPRGEGSKNPGATNVLRIAGKKAAGLTLFGDMLKGFVPVLIATAFLQNNLAIALIGFSAFIGHCYPVYYQFQGGKGVATAIGFIVAFDWLVGLLVVAIWLIVAKISKLSALAALIAFTCMPFIYYGFRNDLGTTVLLILLTLILIYRHRENIQRLMKGIEQTSKITKD